MTKMIQTVEQAIEAAAEIVECSSFTFTAGGRLHHHTAKRMAIASEIRALTAHIAAPDEVGTEARALKVLHEITRAYLETDFNSPHSMRMAMTKIDKLAIAALASTPIPLVDPVRDDLAGEREAAFESTLAQRLKYMRDGLPEGVWEVWTSNSYRRITAPRGPDGGVLSGIIQRSDGHPDLSMNEEQLQNLVGIINAVPEIIAALRQRDEIRTLTAHIAAPDEVGEKLSDRTGTMTDEHIKHMVQRFLMWRLPEPFRPDSGISFTPPAHPASYPIGTNLFDYNQAEAMVRHMVEELSDSENVEERVRRALRKFWQSDGPELGCWPFSYETHEKLVQRIVATINE